MFSLQGNLAQRLALRVPTLGGAAAATWTPAEATTDGGVSPHTWYYAGQLDGNDNDAVASMTNQGSDSHSITQGTVDRQPTLKTAVLNGEDVLRHATDKDWLQGAYTAALTQPLTVFLVAQLDNSVVADGSYHVAIDGDDASNRAMIAKDNSDRWAIFGGAWASSVGTSADANWNIFGAVFNGASSLLYLGGTQIISASAGTHDPDGLTVGGQYTGNSQWTGDIAELLIYDSNLSDADKNEVGGYLATKYNLTWSDIT